MLQQQHLTGLQADKEDAFGNVSSESSQNGDENEDVTRRPTGMHTANATHQMPSN